MKEKLVIATIITVALVCTSCFIIASSEQVVADDQNTTQNDVLLNQNSDYRMMIGDNLYLTTYPNYVGYVVISGYGPSYDYSEKEVPWSEIGLDKDKIKDVWIRQSYSQDIEIIGLFKDCKNLTSVSIESPVKIGASAFKDCASLKTVDFDKIKYVGNSAFENCTSLERVHLDYGDEKGSYYFTFIVGDNAFKNCTALKSIYLNNVDKIGKSAFENCKSLVAADIWVRNELKEATFKDCDGLKFVFFERPTNNIGKEAFMGCTSLLQVYLKGQNVIEDKAFYDCISLDVIDFGHIKSIGRYAFAFSAIKNVDVAPESISDHAFIGCSKLKTAKIYGDIKYLESGVFKDCISLESVYFDKPIDIGDSAFNGCSSLKNISMEKIRNIGNSAFADCSDLKVLSFPQSEDIKIKIGDYAFKNCNIERLEIGDSVIEIGTNAFFNETNPGSLSKIVFGNSLETIGDKPFSFDLLTEDGTKITDVKDLNGSIFLKEGDSYVRHAKVAVTVDEYVVLTYEGKEYSDETIYVGVGEKVVIVYRSMEKCDATLFINIEEIEGQEGKPIDLTISEDTYITVRYVPSAEGGDPEDHKKLVTFEEGIIVMDGDEIVENGSYVDYGTELTVSIADGSDFVKIKVGNTVVDGKWIVSEDVSFKGFKPEDNHSEITSVVAIAAIASVVLGLFVLCRH